MLVEFLISRDLRLGLEFGQVVHLFGGNLEIQPPSSKLLGLHLYALLKLGSLIEDRVLR